MKASRGNGDRSFQSNGKGDADRTKNVEAYRRNYDQINWRRSTVRRKNEPLAAYVIRQD